MKKDDRELVQEITQALDESIQQDTVTQDRLAAARTRALAELSASREPRINTKWLTWSSAGIATVALALMVVHSPNTPAPQAPDMIAFEWMLSENEAELLLSDLEFYEWAAEEENNSG